MKNYGGDSPEKSVIDFFKAMIAMLLAGGVIAVVLWYFI